VTVDVRLQRLAGSFANSCALAASSHSAAATSELAQRAVFYQQNCGSRGNELGSQYAKQTMRRRQDTTPAASVNADSMAPGFSNASLRCLGRSRAPTALTSRPAGFRPE
jgi:hypothetical protein